MQFSAILSMLFGHSNRKNTTKYLKYTTLPNVVKQPKQREFYLKNNYNSRCKPFKNASSIANRNMIDLAGKWRNYSTDSKSYDFSGSLNENKKNSSKSITKSRVNE